MLTTSPQQPSFDTPILLVIFNRPEKVQRLIEVLKKIRPSRLFISADGPRSTHPEDKDLCESAKKISTSVDWDCEIKTNFHKENMGCAPHVSSAITWFFDNVNEGIIVEDDCIPHPDFFQFTKMLLEKYSNDEDIMMISGNNFQRGNIFGDGDYYFSHYASAWGWATWKRAWQHYKDNLTSISQSEMAEKMQRMNFSPAEKKYWLKYFDNIQKGKYPCWDVCWLFSIWNNEGICITPNTNLVQNIGFGSDSTHTIDSEGRYSIPASPLSSIKHPSDAGSVIKVSREADYALFINSYYQTFIQKSVQKIKMVLRKIFNW